jgi:hypothetical protein
VWDRLRDLLYHNNGNVRSNTIYTVGKLWFRRKEKLLREAFPHYLLTDPINLPGLLAELRWLSGHWDWTLLGQIADAPHYLQRWSLCSTCYEIGGEDPESTTRFLALYDRLSEDSHPLVAVNAAQRSKAIHKLLEGDFRKAGTKSALPVVPSLDFDGLTIRFSHARQVYTLGQLDQFTRALVSAKQDTTTSS